MRHSYFEIYKKLLLSVEWQKTGQWNQKKVSDDEYYVDLVESLFVLEMIMKKEAAPYGTLSWELTYYNGVPYGWCYTLEKFDNSSKK